MSDQTLLSDLCSVCNTHKSKYRCPGCAARTCSLPCYKRHQQWAQCSGKRDPTKFVKKSQLVTPSGIDHDFNFLSGIERNLEKAEATASATGAIPTSNATGRYHREAVNYHRLQSAGVNVIRAPQGLSRQKENRSHQSSTKKAKHNIIWTIEWYDEQKRRVLTQTSSTTSMRDADPFCDDHHKSKKRKLIVPDLSQAPHASSVTAIRADPSQHEDSEHPKKSHDQPVKRLEVDYQESEHVTAGSGTSPHHEEQAAQAQAGVAAAHTRHHVDHESTHECVGGGQHRLYLLKPRTSSTKQVLIPLDPSRTLAESLSGRTVLEFPTIYVFPSSTHDLPTDFMLEEEYSRQQGQEQEEFNDLIKELDPEILKRLKDDDATRYDGREVEVDSKKILDVLKQDLGGEL
ncbi:Box C/D snoRNA accumulation [Coniothyrium glycines]